MIRFVILALFAATVAAAADVPELPVSAPKLVVQPQSPIIAVGKTRRYAVWSDYFIYGMELTADGKPRLETRTKIADARYPLQLFAVDDQFYLVYTNGTTPVFSRCIDTGATRETAYDARLTSNGSRLLERYSTASGEQGVLLSRDLVPVSNPFNLDAPAPYWLEMSAAGGTFFMLAADRNGNAHGKLIDNDGHVTDLGPLLRLGQIASPHLATDGGAYLLVWQPTSFAVFARYITAAGEVTGDLIVIAQATAPVIDFASVAWSGSDYVVGWHDSSASSLNIRHVSGGTAGPPVQVAAPVLGGGVTGGPAGTFALWVVNSTPNTGITSLGAAYAQRLDVADDPDVISYGVPAQYESAVVADAAQSAVVWTEADT
ncbi:MAG TPA: hypothetical protein VG323_03790, partial [Thermoanaerobaculia bacterium]|nr:hypothetical protein [Thermoanaerobaculia bacterium]